MSMLQKLLGTAPAGSTPASSAPVHLKPINPKRVEPISHPGKIPRCVTFPVGVSLSRDWLAVFSNYSWFEPESLRLPCYADSRLCLGAKSWLSAPATLVSGRSIVVRTLPPCP